MNQPRILPSAPCLLSRVWLKPTVRPSAFPDKALEYAVENPRIDVAFQTKNWNHPEQKLSGNSSICQKRYQLPESTFCNSNLNSQTTLKSLLSTLYIAGSTSRRCCGRRSSRCYRAGTGLAGAVGAGTGATATGASNITGPLGRVSKA